MSGTFSQIYYHLVFSTKSRENYISDLIQEELYTYICGIIKKKDGFVYAIGGMPDHIHILCYIPAKTAVSKMLQEIKGCSSAWIHKRFHALSFFQWQSGYGVFSVSHSQREIVKNYICKQQEHHKDMSFKEEFIVLLKIHGVSYDESFIWT
ncbi:MAG: IS200/IS605 family transposase [Lentisphaeraceae bacterium]|nr:IS200/IS605 family transposase [Lentisphaeraceae bacterium]